MMMEMTMTAKASDADKILRKIVADYQAKCQHKYRLILSFTDTEFPCCLECGFPNPNTVD